MNVGAVMIVAVVRIAHVVNLGFVTVFGDGQFIVPVAGRADGKAVAAAVGGADFEPFQRMVAPETSQ